MRQTARGAEAAQRRADARADGTGPALTALEGVSALPAHVVLEACSVLTLDRRAVTTYERLGVPFRVIAG